jgi:predicted hotdog family 3-hydroxylacyl-ACP dehydratase
MVDKELDLEVLLPHRAPMILLDRVLDYGDDFSSAELHIHPDNLFFDAELDGVPAWVGIEYMAQTMGIWSGSQHLSDNRPIEIGFLLGSRLYQSSHSVFANGARLKVDAKVLLKGEDGIGAFECTINRIQADSESAVIASARINAFLPDDSAEFIKGQS